MSNQRIRSDLDRKINQCDYHRNRADELPIVAQQLGDCSMIHGFLQRLNIGRLPQNLGLPEVNDGSRAPSDSTQEHRRLATGLLPSLANGYGRPLRAAAYPMFMSTQPRCHCKSGTPSPTYHQTAEPGLLSSC